MVMVFKRVKVFLIVMLFSAAAAAENVSFSFELRDKDGKVFEDAVVSLMPTDSSLIMPPPSGAVTEMEQKDKQFTPHILVVQKGQSVSFPNRDDIQHHVFSFSETKSFELQLYKEDVPSPLVFDNVGDVELGCSVHDWMLGYIKVVETPYFAKTDDQGRVYLQELPAGEYNLSVWHPRIVNKSNGFTMQVDVSKDVLLNHQLEVDVLPPLLGFDSFEQDAEYQ